MTDPGPAAFEPPPGFTVLSRAEWATCGQPNGDSTAPAPVTEAEWREVYIPLSLVVRRALDGPHSIVSLTGSVGAGKSTIAAGLAALLTDRSVAVVSTDGFLYPTAALAPSGRAGFKGFPDTYDTELMARVLTALVNGEPAVEVPLYSHVIYDRAPEPLILASPDVVILEGVNAFAAGDLARLRIYVDADEPDLRAWFVRRFLGLIDAARSDPASFYAKWTELPPDDAESLATAVWDTVNLPNLEQHILATRWDADIVLHKRFDHSVTAVAIRSSLLPDPP